MAVPYTIGNPYIDADFAAAGGDTGISAGTYGDATHIPRITLNAQGRVTAVSAVAIATVAGTVSTTTAAATTIATVAIPTSQTMLITVNVAARRTGGASGSTGDGAAYQLAVAAKNIAGTVTIIGQTITFTAEDQAGWTVDAAVSTTNVIIRVAGAAANNIDWIVSGQSLGVG